MNYYISTKKILLKKVPCINHCLQHNENHSNTLEYYSTDDQNIIQLTISIDDFKIKSFNWRNEFSR